MWRHRQLRESAPRILVAVDLFEKANISLVDGPDFGAESALVGDIARERSDDDIHLKIAGVDEVGRGPLAGPVVAAAVILDPENFPVGLDDSKKLTAKKRSCLAEQIREKAIAISVAEVSVADIDAMNILEAAMLAMRQAVQNLPVSPDGVLVDGNRDPNFGDLPTRTLVKGDGRSLSIAAASIIAKIFRDNLMQKLGVEYPDYGWAQNAGYGVPKHMAALKLVGISPHHRKSFAPIRKILDEKNNTNY